MIIKFLDEQYEVIQKIKTTSILDLYVARNLSEAQQKNYTVACIRNSELMRQLIPVTTKNNTSMAFKDFKGSFIAEGKYYIIFDHARGQTLQQALQDNYYHLKERLVLVKNILSQILMLDMPYCFVYEVLRKDNIVVDEALGIKFNYFFTEVDYYEQIGEKYCLRRIHELMQEIFSKEIAEKSSAELKEFLKDFERGVYECIWDCYEAFDTVCDHLIMQSDNQEIKPGHIWWKAWDFLKKKAALLRTILVVVVIVVAGIYLIYTLPNPVMSDKGITFLRIGTLEIQEQNR